MIIVKQTENGNITINRNVIAKIVLSEVNSMTDSFVLCNKKGKIYKKNILSDEFYNISSIEVIGKDGIEIIINALIFPGKDFDECANILFNKIEAHFASIGICKPDFIAVAYKGIYGQPFLGDEIVVERQ